MSEHAAFPAVPRRAFAVQAAANFLEELGISLLPIDPVSIAQTCGWRLQSYSGAADRMHLSLSEFRMESGSREAFTSHRRRPVIFYDDTIRNRRRLNFSLCHEIGHIVLGHLTDFRHLHPTDDQLRLLDREASIFAANMMAPPAVAAAMKPALRIRCGRIFGMSSAAWAVRLEMLDGDLACLSASHQAVQLAQFDAWMHTMRCRSCSRTFHGTSNSACPHCGNTQLMWDPHSAASHLLVPEQRKTPPVIPAQRSGKQSEMLYADLENPMLNE